MLQLSFDVNTNIFSLPLFSSREISCIFYYVSYLLLLSYIKGFEDKEPDFENIILLKIYLLILTTSSAEREKLSINYLRALCKTHTCTLYSAKSARSEILLLPPAPTHLGPFPTFSMLDYSSYHLNVIPS